MTLPGTLKLILTLVIVGLLALLVVPIYSLHARGCEYLRNLAAQELARQTEREVQLGEISGNLLTGVQIHHVAIGVEGGLDQGVAVAAERVGLRYDLFAVLRGDLAAPASIKQITIDRAYALIDRSAEGKFNLAKLFKPKPPHKVPPAKRFQPVVVVRNSVVDLVAAGVEGKTLTLRLTEVNGRVKLNPVGPMEIQLSAQSGDGNFGTLSLQALSDTQEHFVIVRGRVTGLPLERWASVWLPNSGVSITSGSASGNFEVWMVPSAGSTVGPILPLLKEDEEPPEFQRQIGFLAEVEVHDASIHLQQMRGAPWHVSRAHMKVSPQGLQIAKLQGSWLGAAFNLEGCVYDWKEPRADLHLTADRLDLAAVRANLPPQMAKTLPADVAGAAQLELAAIGPLHHLNTSLSVVMREGATVATKDSGEINLQELALEAQVFDTAQPAVAASTTLGGVSLPPELFASLSGAQGPEEAQPSPAQVQVCEIGSLRADVVWTGDQPLVAGSFSKVAGRVGGVEVNTVGSDFAWVGKQLRARDLQADLLGGHVSLEAFVRLPDAHLSKPEVVVNGTLEDLDLAAIPPSLRGDSSEPLGGTARAKIGVSWDGQQGNAVLELGAQDLSYEKYELEQASGLALVDFDESGDWRLDLPLLTAQRAGLNTWIYGTASRDGPVDLYADLGALDLARCPLVEEGIAGRAYGQVRLTGSWEAPELAGKVVVFHPQYQEYEGSALLIKLRARTARPEADSGLALEEAEVEAYASYDTAVAHTALALRPSLAGESTRQVRGQVQLSELRLAALRSLLGESWPAQADLKGTVQLRVDIGGTTEAPEADGELLVSPLLYKDYYVNAVRVPLHLEMNPEAENYLVLVIKDADLTVQGATLAFGGRWEGGSEDWSFSAQAQAGGIKLERLAFLEQLRLPLAGEVLMPRILIKGSPTGLSGEGRIIADRILVVDAPITGLDTRFVISAGEVRLERTSLETAGGTVAGQLSYLLDSQALAGDLEVSHLQLSRLLKLIGPLVAAAKPEPEAADAVRQQWRQASVRAEGCLDGEIQFQGPLDKLVAQTSISLEQAAWAGKPLPIVRGTVEADLAAQTVRSLATEESNHLELQMGEALVTVEGEATLGGNLSVTADATNVDLAVFRDWLPGDLGLGGIAGIFIQAEGPISSPRLTASVDVTPLSVRGVSFDLLTIPTVEVSDQGIDLANIILKRKEREIVASGHLPFSWDPLGVPAEEAIAFTAKLENSDLSFFPPIIDELVRGLAGEETFGQPTRWAQTTASGAVNAEIAVTGTLQQPALNGFVHLDQGAVNQPGWQHPLTHLNMDLALHSTTHTDTAVVRQFSGRWDETEFQLTGETDLKGFHAQAMAGNRFDLTLNLSADSQELLSGTILDDLQGQVTLKTSSLGEHLLTVEKLGGKLGRGRANLSGTVVMTHFTGATFADNDFHLELQVADADVAYAGIFTGVVEGAVQVSNPQPGQAAEVKGKLAVSHAVGGLPPSSKKQAVEPLRAMGPDFPHFTFNLAMDLAEDVVFKMPGLTATVEPAPAALVARGTPQAPIIQAKAEMQPSQISLPGGSFKVNSGGMRLDLAPEHTWTSEPRVRLQIALNYWATAEQDIPTAMVNGRELGPVHIILEINGKLPNTPETKDVIQVKSDPQLSEDQILTLIGMRPFQGAGPTDLSQAVSEQFASLLAIGFREALLAPIAAELRRSLGLSEFTVNFSFDQPLEVRIGKYVFRHLLVSYRFRAVGPEQEEWDLALNYVLPSRYQVSYSTDENGENQFRVSHGWTF